MVAIESSFRYLVVAIVQCSIVDRVVHHITLVFSVIRFISPHISCSLGIMGVLGDQFQGSVGALGSGSVAVGRCPVRGLSLF